MGQTNKERPFSSYKAYERAISRLDAKFERKYPVIRLLRPPKGYKRIWEKARVEYDIESEKLKSRLPTVPIIGDFSKYVETQQRIQKKFPGLLDGVPSDNDDTVPISPLEIDTRDPNAPIGTLLDYYEKIHPSALVYRPSRSGINPICKTCKKMSVYRKGDPEKPLMPDFLWGREIVTFQKFKYRNYCSDECKREAHNKLRRKVKEKRICPICHVEYEGRGKTCKKSACRKQVFREMKKEFQPSFRGAFSLSFTDELETGFFH